MSEKDAGIYVTLLGERIRLVMPVEGWTFEEARLAKTASEGMAPVEVEERAMLGDPDAWLAILQVSYFRVDKPFPLGEIDKMDMSDLAKRIVEARDKLEGGDNDRPPPKPPKGLS